VKLTVNGAGREVPDGVRIPELLALLCVASGQVAVEVNGRVVRRAQHADVQLQPGDQVEVVTFVGGG
jgi:thiamine biosynthesis protein ThiS